MSEKFTPEWRDFTTPPDYWQECIVQWIDDSVEVGWLYIGDGKNNHIFTDVPTQSERRIRPKYWLPLPEPKR
ncbi:hypothetical protein M7963_05925 [Enterobacter roggenkampii]|uniref:hypothetical protein n=1 Tax=Enterobacter roggenkampii TaxID=1812935 RepID=UPI0022389532|nr:hypothetical protein [Enterobacter roggenkampii]MCW5001049.1 hypothetical protein [Enterobacter roggenkampii]